MTVYYKATRAPEGTDFWSGTVDYAAALTSGTPVRPREPDLGPAEEGVFCRPGRLYAADVPAETLVTGGWPCRLFTVEGTPVEGFDGEHPHKGAFHELTVTGELPGWQALGPNGDRVVALIDRARSLSADELDRLNAAGDAADAAWADAVGDAADAAAGDAARDAAGNAATALVVADLITAEHFDVLYGPWRTAIGQDPA